MDAALEGRSGRAKSVHTNSVLFQMCSAPLPPSWRYLQRRNQISSFLLPPLPPVPTTALFLGHSGHCQGGKIFSTVNCIPGRGGGGGGATRPISDVKQVKQHRRRAAGADAHFLSLPNFYHGFFFGQLQLSSQPENRSVCVLLSPLAR